jgi:hypothetical protein
MPVSDSSLAFTLGKRVDVRRCANDAPMLRICWLSANRVKPNARRNFMNFGLLLSQLPHVDESRIHYEAMLALHARESHKFAALLQRLKTLIS